MIYDASLMIVCNQSGHNLRGHEQANHLLFILCQKKSYHLNKYLHF